MRLSVFPQDKKKYLDTIHSYMEVHGTVHGTSTVHLPSYVKNHGILSGRDLQFLLRETKVSPPLLAGSGASRLEIYQCTSSTRASEKRFGPLVGRVAAQEVARKEKELKKNSKNTYKNYARK